MPVVVVAQAALALQKSGALKALTDAGTKVLGMLSGCKIKPKGTPHAEVYNKAPKILYRYGGDITGAMKPSGRTEGYSYDIATGALITIPFTDVLSLDDRRKIEASLRKPCESVTGDMSFYIEVRPVQDDKGVVLAKDGIRYDAGLFGNVIGGSPASPLKMDALPPNPVPQSDAVGAEVTKTTSIVGNKVFLGALAYFAIRRFGG